MGAPVKFLFEDDFASTHTAARATIARATHEAALKRAEAEAYQSGIAAAEARIEGRAASACERVAQGVAALAQGLAAIEARLEAESVEVAVAVARKLCDALMASEPLGEITALVSDCFSHLVSTPHLVVRINASLYEAARERIERLAKQSGFAGRLVILAEPEIDTGDCRIEWADGGVVLERAAIEAKINELVGRYMASRNKTDGMRTEP